MRILLIICRSCRWRWLWLPLSVMVLNSCKEGAQPWQSFGEIVQENRELTDFDKVRVRGKLLLYLFQDSSRDRSASITWGEHVINGMITEINSDGELLIEDRNSARWLRRLDTQAVCTLNVWGIRRIVSKTMCK